MQNDSLEQHCLLAYPSEYPGAYSSTVLQPAASHTLPNHAPHTECNTGQTCPGRQIGSLWGAGLLPRARACSCNTCQRLAAVAMPKKPSKGRVQALCSQHTLSAAVPAASLPAAPSASPSKPAWIYPYHGHCMRPAKWSVGGCGSQCDCHLTARRLRTQGLMAGAFRGRSVPHGAAVKHTQCNALSLGST
jgi:hypothetical protein